MCVCMYIIVTFPRRSSMSLKGIRFYQGNVTYCWTLPLATHYHILCHLHPFHFVLLKFKTLVAKQHPMNVCAGTYDAYNAHSSGVLLMLSYILCRGKKQCHSDDLSHLWCPSQPGGWLRCLSTYIHTTVLV